MWTIVIYMYKKSNSLIITTLRTNICDYEIIGININKISSTVKVVLIKSIRGKPCRGY